MENETIRTSAKVRVMLTFNYNNFEVETEIKNDAGITDAEINSERVSVEALVKHAVEDFKKVSDLPTKDAIKKIRSQLDTVSKQIGENEEIKVDPKEVEKIAALPLYEPKKSKK